MTEPKEISLTYMSGVLDGKTLRFPQPSVGEQIVLTIGRRETCDVHLPYDNQASRIHARMGCVASPVNNTDEIGVLSFWLEDSYSRNGTYIKNSQNPISERVELRPDTLFRAGRTWLRLDVPFSLDSA